MSQKTALVVGASRGLGLALVGEYLNRGWRVVATVRSTSRHDELTALHQRAAGVLDIEQVDITRPEEIAALRERLHGRVLDLLFVNAGVVNDDRDSTLDQVTDDEFVRVMVTNALGPMRVVEALQDQVPRGGTIAVMSSGLASVTNNVAGGWDVYRASKAAVNTLMRCFAARHEGDGRTLVLVAPGWIRTALGGADAPFDAETNIRAVVDVIARRSRQPGLHFVNFRDEDVPW